MNAWRPILVFALNFIVGVLVTQGVIPHDQHDQLVNDLADALGYLIIFITSIAAIAHTFKHPNATGGGNPVVNQIVKTETKTEAVFTEREEPNPGTPPPLN